MVKKAKPAINKKPGYQETLGQINELLMQMETDAQDVADLKTHMKFKYLHKSNLKFKGLLRALEEQFDGINKRISDM